MARRKRLTKYQPTNQTDFMEIKDRHIRFAWGIAAGLKQKQAAILAGVKPHLASDSAHRWMCEPGVRAHIRDRRNQLAAVTGIDRNWLLDKWVQIANADVNDVVSHRRISCRYCNGLNHDYQWTEKEFELALDDWQAKCAATEDGKPQPPPPDPKGGFGFHPDTAPHPECPMCFGRGQQEVYIADTRNLKGGAALLYQGAKETKNGIEVKTVDKIEALQKIGEFLGIKGPSTVVNNMAIAGAQATVEAIPEDATAQTLTRAQLKAIAASSAVLKETKTALEGEPSTSVLPDRQT